MHTFRYYCISIVFAVDKMSEAWKSPFLPLSTWVFSCDLGTIRNGLKSCSYRRFLNKNLLWFFHPDFGVYQWWLSPMQLQKVPDTRKTFNWSTSVVSPFPVRTRRQVKSPKSHNSSPIHVPTSPLLHHMWEVLNSQEELGRTGLGLDIAAVSVACRERAQEPAQWPCEWGGAVTLAIVTLPSRRFSWMHCWCWQMLHSSSIDPCRWQCDHGHKPDSSFHFFGEQN